MSRAIGHYAPWLLGAIVAGLMVLTLLPPIPLLVSYIALVVMLALAVGMAGALISHNRGLCERCVRSVPLAASKAASRRGLQFRAAHLFGRPVFAIGYLVVLTGVAAVSDHPVGRYAWAAVLTSLGYLLIVYVTHQRLAPWCPQCRGGGQELSTQVPPRPVRSAG